MLFFQVVCKTFSYSVHSVFTSAADIPKAVIFSFLQWYCILLWLYSHAIVFHPNFLFFLTSNLSFYLPNCLYSSYPTFPNLPPLYSNYTTSLLTEHSRSVLLLTIQNKSRRSWIWQRLRVAHVQNRWSLRKLQLLRLNHFTAGFVHSLFTRRLRTGPF